MSAEGKGKRGAAGVSNAEAEFYASKRSAVIGGPLRREVYKMAGLTKIRPYIRGGQTGTPDKKG